MKQKRQRVDKKPLLLRWDRKLHRFVVEGVANPPKPFVTREDGENYCIQHLGKCPVVITNQPEVHQDLPERSVWTGAPWDKNFEDV